MNQKIKLIPLLLFSAFATQAAKDVKVMQYLHAGPITVNKPILTDSLNVDGKPFEAKNLVRIGLLTVIGPAWRYCITLTSFAACVAKAEKRSNGISLIF